MTPRQWPTRPSYALDAEAQILPYYNDYFGTPYPLPKLDNVAGPGQSQFFSAMENWGAIFTFEYAILDDPAITTRGAAPGDLRHRSARDGAPVVRRPRHHGLVGRPVAQRGLRQLDGRTRRPSISIPTGAPTSTASARAKRAMGLDALNSTHPVVQQVRTVEQANQAFDAITYSKGESVIAMLEEFAGARRVARRASATTSPRTPTRTRAPTDLWAAVERAGATGLTTIATDFTTPARHSADPGRPGAVRQRPDRRHAHAGAIFRDRPAARSPPSPLSLARAGPRDAPAARRRQVVTSGPTTQLTVPGCGPLLVNAGPDRLFPHALHAAAGAGAAAARCRSSRRSTNTA